MMRLLNRAPELERLNRLSAQGDGGLAVVYGRRRIGKTRLLLEWTARHRGVYWVADQSAPEVQRRYLALALSGVLPGFSEVEYPDWRALLARLSNDAIARGFRGPVVLDELPYLVASSPELPSVLQQFVDHGGRAARLVLAVAGSSQRMMQGLVLGAQAPLFGRAQVVLDVGPLSLPWVAAALRPRTTVELVEHYAAWGGVPRYLELALAAGGAARSVAGLIDDLVLDPRGPLHQEPDRLLLEENPSALEVRPLLDAIGHGAHRVSEIAGRLGRPATSMARPLDRLVGMGLVRRELPFGVSERSSRRSLYRIRDPFFRLWFRVVAPYRGALAGGNRAARRAVLMRSWSALVAQAWEELCRERLPALDLTRLVGLGSLGPLTAPARWWHGSAPEWDLVAAAPEAKTLILGESKWSHRPVHRRELVAAATRLRFRPVPPLGDGYRGWRELRLLFVPETERGIRRRFGGVVLVRGRDLLSRSAD